MMSHCHKTLLLAGFLVTASVSVRADVPLERRFAYADRFQEERLFEEAIAGYAEAATFTEDNEQLARAHFEMGNCYKGLKEHKKALTHYMKVSEVYHGSRRADAMYEVATLCRDHLKKPGLAVKSLNALVGEFPRHTRASDALYDIGRIQERGDKYEEAIETYNRNVETYPKTEAAERSLAQVAEITLKRHKRPLDASEVWMKFGKMYPDSSTPALFNAAEILEKEGKFQEAIKAYEAFLEKHPSHKVSDTARKRRDGLIKKHGR
jgi:TolA-binding protein